MSLLHGSQVSVRPEGSNAIWILFHSFTGESIHPLYILSIRQCLGGDSGNLDPLIISIILEVNAESFDDFIMSRFMVWVGEINGFTDPVAMMDDVAMMSKVATKKTAGILGDDLAVNAEKGTAFSAYAGYFNYDQWNIWT